MLGSEKVMVVIAGPNGSGKSTYFSELTSLHHLAFINADIIAKENAVKGISPKDLRDASWRAQRDAQGQIQEHFAMGKSFCFETVFSHPSKLELIEEAKARGYIVHLYVVYSGNQNVNIMRVAQRISHGGHSVPRDKIVSRTPKRLSLLKEALVVTDYFRLIDSSGAKSPFLVIAETNKRREVIVSLSTLPKWALILLSQVRDRIKNKESKMLAVGSNVDKGVVCGECGRPLRAMRKKIGVCSHCKPRL